ncbi:MAG: HNH endonuclease [Caldilineales bacterium]|nr:HNH endonuclease [Caldilineales bacterium]
MTEQAEYRCGYCQTPQSFTAMPLHVEHIIPLAAGGSSSESNLWLACPLCNGHKGVQTVARDPVTGMQVPLFDPRRQLWSDHFRWSEDGIHIVGSTPCGRATVIALKLNHAHLTGARQRWVAVGWHPPRT